MKGNGSTGCVNYRTGNVSDIFPVPAVNTSMVVNLQREKPSENGNSAYLMYIKYGNLGERDAYGLMFNGQAATRVSKNGTSIAAIYPISGDSTDTVMITNLGDGEFRAVYRKEMF